LQRQSEARNGADKACASCRRADAHEEDTDRYSGLRRRTSEGELLWDVIQKRATFALFTFWLIFRAEEFAG